MARQETGTGLIKKCCKLLLSYGIKEVIFEYDGSGDSGDMHSIRLVVSPSQEQIDDCLKDVSSPNNDTVRLATREKMIWWDDFVAERKKEKNPIITPEMCDQIADAAFELLPGGWEINDGSFGTVTVDTTNETIEVEHNERYTDVRTETFTY